MPTLKRNKTSGKDVGKSAKLELEKKASNESSSYSRSGDNREPPIL
jgi:hypothetical protein